MFLVVIDAYSKWLEVHCMKSTTSSATIEKLREIFAIHGLPATLVSDNGSNFTSSEFEEFMKRNGIKHIKVAPYHPVSNGLAERAVRVFKEGFEKMGEGSIQTKLSRFLLSYRTTPHSTTGVPPAELLMKGKLRTQLDRLYPNVADRVRSKQSKQKAAHDYHAKERILDEGQAVYVKDFRYKKTWMPGTVVDKTGPVSARIQLDDGSVSRRHQDHVRVRESKPALDTVGSEVLEAAPMAISIPVATSEPDASSPPKSSSPDTHKPPSTSPVKSPVNRSPKQSRPVRRRVRPAYLEDYHC